MTTTHEYDTYLDAQPDTLVIDERYHEDIVCTQQQIQDEAEMKESYDSELKRQGAKESLAELRSYLMYCAVQDGHEGAFAGLKWAVDSINLRLADLEPVEGGAV